MENGYIEVTVNGNDFQYQYDQLGLTFDSSESEVLNALEGILLENNISLKDEHGNFLYTTRKALNTQVIHAYPNSEKG